MVSSCTSIYHLFPYALFKFKMFQTLVSILHQYVLIMEPNIDNQPDLEDELIHAAKAICAIAATKYFGSYIDKKPRENNYHTPCPFFKKIIESDEHCYNLLRMNIHYFKRFVHEIRHHRSYMTPSIVK